MSPCFLLDDVSSKLVKVQLSREQASAAVQVREALAAGKLSQVADYLGRPYCLVANMSCAEVMRHRGNALGTEFLRRCVQSLESCSPNAQPSPLVSVCIDACMPVRPE